MNQDKDIITANLTIEISPTELNHLEEYRKLSDSEKENIDRIIEMCIKAKESH